MKLSIILLNYKRKELTLACIDSVYKQFRNEFEESIFEIIIVDNNSQDDSVERIKKEIKKYKNTRLVLSRENLGFGKGCNLGATFAKGEYFLFLNNDTEVKDRGFLGMISFFENNEKIGIVGGRMINIDGTLQASTGKFYTFFNAILMLIGLQRLGFLYTSPKKNQSVDWVSGGCMMIKRDVFEKINGFERDMFMYVEDVDICFRAKKMGFQTYFYSDVEVVHSEHGSGNRSSAISQIYPSILIFYKKHMPVWQYFLIQLILRLKAWTAIFVGKVFNKPFLVERYEKALANI